MWHPLMGPPARVLSPLFFPALISCCLSHAAKRSTSKPHGPPSSPPKPPGPLFSFRTTWSSPSTAVVARLNPSAHLPLQPHFQLLLQSVTPASIPVFFQLYWAAVVSLGRCSPMAWSQSSPSSHAGAVTRGSYFSVTSWVEFAPIPLAHSMSTAI